MVLYKADVHGIVTIPSNPSVVIISKGNVDPKAVKIVFTAPSHVVIIGDNAFQNFSKLTSISLPKSVLSIGINAFQNCVQLGVGSVFILPRSVEIVGAGAFSGCFIRTKINKSNSTVIMTKRPTLLAH